VHRAGDQVGGRLGQFRQVGAQVVGRPPGDDEDPVLPRPQRLPAQRLAREFLRACPLQQLRAPALGGAGLPHHRHDGHE
jgi:hypothetical protein